MGHAPQASTLGRMQRPAAARGTAAGQRRGVSLDRAIAAWLPQRVFAQDDGSRPYGRAATFQRLLAAAGLGRDPHTGQPRTLYNSRHTHATTELPSGTDIHTLARQAGTSVLMLERRCRTLPTTMAAGRLA